MRHVAIVACILGLTFCVRYVVSAEASAETEAAPDAGTAARSAKVLMPAITHDPQLLVCIYEESKVALTCVNYEDFAKRLGALELPRHAPRRQHPSAIY